MALIDLYKENELLFYLLDSKSKVWKMISRELGKRNIQVN